MNVMSSCGLMLSKNDVSMSSEGLDLRVRKRGLEGWCEGGGRREKRREEVEKEREREGEERELRAEESEGAAMEGDEGGKLRKRLILILNNTHCVVDCSER